MPIDAADSVLALRLVPGSGPVADRRVVRGRLLARLAEVRDRPVVVVSGPAGSGKSTLAVQLRDADARAQAFVRLGDHDDDPVVLASRLVDALESVGPAAPLTRASVSAVEPGFSALLLPAMELLPGSRGRPYLLVIDDVHLLRRPQCWDLLVALAAGIPPGSTLVLLTREEAHERLARTRAEGRLEEVGPTDLALDRAEATELFRHLGLNLPDATVAGLVDHCEGWAVGLYLSGLAARRQGSSSGDDLMPASPRGSDAYILDYVETEVLDPLPPDERTFLVRSAVLDELHAGLCDAVLGRHDSGGVLARLHRRTQLVTQVDHDGRFRCHHLLREALLADLELNDAGLRGTLQARAARWYADNGDLDAAVRHAKAADDLPLVSELVWSGILGCIGSGWPARLEVWLGGLTEHQVSSDSWLSLASAWAAMQSGEPDRMLRWQARSRVHAGRDWRDRIRSDEYAASLAVLETVVGAGGLDDCVSLADGALVGLPADSGFRAVASFIRGVSLTMLRRAEEGQTSLREAQSLAGAFTVPLIEADALSWLGMLAMTSGDTTRGSQLIGQAAGVIEAHHLERLASSAHCLTAQAYLLAMTHRPDAAATLASARRLTALVPAIAPWFAVCGRLIQARAAIALDDGALARTLLADARRAMTPDLAASLAQDLLDGTTQSLESLSRDGVSAAALTAAEMRVLQFLPSHLTLPMIGEHLFLSPNTVKSHALAIYRKFGVSSRSEAVVVAQSLGLVEGPTRS